MPGSHNPARCGMINSTVFVLFGGATINANDDLEYGDRTVILRWRERDRAYVARWAPRPRSASPRIRAAR